MDHETTMWIKKEEAYEVTNEAGSTGHRIITVDHEATMWIKKEEADEFSNEPGSMFVEDTLGISWSSDYIKEEPELHLEGEETEHVVVTQSRLEPEKMFIQNSDGSCGISLEANVEEGVVPSQLDIGAEKSTQFAKFITHRRLASQEDSSFGTRLNCRLRENKLQKFNCSSCLCSFHSKYRLIMHVFIHIGGVQPPAYVCKSCGEVFCSNASLMKHFKESYSDEVSPASQNDETDCIYNYENLLEGDGVSSPEMPEKHFSTMETRNISKKYFNDVCRTHAASDNAKNRDRWDNYGALNPNGDFKDHTVPHTAKRGHKCELCGKSFTRLGNLKNHALIHTRMSPHKCGVCGKCFTTLGNLKMHILIHTGMRQHKCDVCGKSFTQVITLKQHAVIHTGMRPQKCDVCGKSFTYLGSLRNHELIHTGMRPHKCVDCGKSFTHLRNLKSHALIHTGMRPHKCADCGKSFTHLFTLKQHAVIHTGMRPHKCDVCGKSFTNVSNLRKHELIHTGMRPHKCADCGKSFTHLWHLKSHALIHTGMRQHKCDDCGKTFIQLWNLKRHALIHTRTRPQKY